MNIYRSFIQIAAILGALSVALGAFAAHGLKEKVSTNALQIFETGVRYQFYHVFALALTGVLFYFSNTQLMRLSGILFIIGIILFSGSLYVLTYAVNANNTALMKLGIVTPFGGLCFIAGWVLLAFALAKK